MRHIDILIHIITLFSGVMTALLGFLLYLKYKSKAIRHYSLFILTTTFTVATTTLMSYSSQFVNIDQNSWPFMISSLVFAFFIVLIGYAFISFALGIINKPFSMLSRILTGIPALLVLLSLFAILYQNLGKTSVVFPGAVNFFYYGNLFFLFLNFVFYSIRIMFNLKFMDNLDLRRALKVLALLFIVFIPVQTMIVIFNRQVSVIMLSRNLFYFLANVLSIIFAAKYFFLKTPNIAERFDLNDRFINNFGITDREKEVIELLIGGNSIKEISGKLNRSFKTINNHIYNIYQKARVSSKLELLNVIRDNI